MELNEINGVPFKPADGSGESDSVGLADDFDAFLLLLTTQLQYQDPLEPLDTNQFTEQLVQFSGVEQSIKTNDKLEELIALQSGNQLGQAVSYIGKTIKVESSQLWLEDGGTTILYGLSQQAQETSITVLDQNGKAVRVFTGDTTPGLHEIEWDGTDGSGGQLPEGVYTMVVNATDANGETISTASGMLGRVTGVEFQEDDLLLSVGDLLLPIDQVLAISEAPDEPAAL